MAREREGRRGSDLIITRVVIDGDRHLHLARERKHDLLVTVFLVFLPSTLL